VSQLKDEDGGPGGLRWTDMSVSG